MQQRKIPRKSVGIWTKRSEGPKIQINKKYRQSTDANISPLTNCNETTVESVSRRERLTQLLYWNNYIKEAFYRVQINGWWHECRKKIGNRKKERKNERYRMKKGKISQEKRKISKDIETKIMKEKKEIYRKKEW